MLVVVQSPSCQIPLQFSSDFVRCNFRPILNFRRHYFDFLGLFDIFASNVVDLVPVIIQGRLLLLFLYQKLINLVLYIHNVVIDGVTKGPEVLKDGEKSLSPLWMGVEQVTETEGCGAYKK